MFSQLTLSCVVSLLLLAHPGNAFQVNAKLTFGYGTAPEKIQESKAFQRERWFYQQRMSPDGMIPPGAYIRAQAQRDGMKNSAMGNEVSGTWLSIGPAPTADLGGLPVTGRVVSVAFHPSENNTIFIGGANGGIWKSTNAGGAWTPLTDDLASLATGSIAIDLITPSTIYFGTGEATYGGFSYFGAGLMKSIDGGVSWERYTAGLPTNTYFSRLRIRPNHPGELFASMGWDGVYGSINGGESWFTILGGRCDDIAFSPGGDTAFVVGSGVGLMRSIDGGVTFGQFGTGLPANSVVRTHIDLCATNPSIMYAVTYESVAPEYVKVYKSFDYGETWQRVGFLTDFDGDQGWFDLAIAVQPSNPDFVLVGTKFRFVSTNGGQTWGRYLGTHADQHTFAFDQSQPERFLFGNDGGIYQGYINGGGGISWLTHNSPGLSLTQFYDISTSPFNPDVVAGGTQDNGSQVTASHPFWAQFYGGDGGQIAFNQFDPHYVLGETQWGGIFRTTNTGLSWQSATNGIDMNEFAAWIAPIIVHPTESGTFYTARNRVYKTTDNAGVWYPISEVFGGPVSALAISETNPDVIFAALQYEIFRTVDGGATWVYLGEPGPGGYATSLYVHPVDASLVLLTRSGFGGGHVFSSTDQGNSWHDISGNLPDSPVNDIFLAPWSIYMYVVATDVGIFQTEDGGVTWTSFDNGLPNTVFMSLDYSELDGKLRTGTYGRGVYELEFVPSAAEENGNQIHKGYGLSQNYPNPFNAGTTIRFFLERSVEVSLKVFNLLGEEVADLVSGDRNAGNHSVHWEGVGLPSGVYYYRLKAGGVVETRRILLLR